ncbi:hypothetical protein BGX27_011256 [Mortierella sp. AM989]|nr:hypothetical protein BGX27_011256 [Mortierella sp. AM989]
MTRFNKKRISRDIVPSTVPHSAKATSPIELPEILAKILSFLSSPNLARACQVSRLFHSIAAPLIWQTIGFDGETAKSIWQKNKGFRMGLIRYGRFVEHIILMWGSIQDGDMELIAENCTRLKTLDLTGSNITAETLKVLIHSDPYKTLPTSAKKRKRKQSSDRRKGQNTEEDGDDEDNEDGGNNDDVNAKMFKYRSMTETETENETYYRHNYESVGLEPSTATESEQEQQRQHQATGPVLVSSTSTTTTSRPRTRSVTRNPAQSMVSTVIPPHRRAGTTRAAKFKGTRTQFPYHLETLVLNRCKELTGKSCLAVVSLLGPQLKSLSLNYINELKDHDLLEMLKHCPNLGEISLKGTEVSDNFLRTISGVADSNDQQKRSLELLNVDMTSTSYDGLVPLISASLSKMSSLSCEHNMLESDEILYAFIEDPELVKSRYRGGKAQRERAVLAASLTKRSFIPNTVLTYINLSYCNNFKDSGLKALFEYATELTDVKLDGCQVTDESLMTLAEANRTRMARLGYGVPAAWHEHEVAMERILAPKGSKRKPKSASKAKGSRKGKASATIQDDGEIEPEVETGTTDAIETLSSSTSSEAAKKIYTKGFYKGGLELLSLTNCRKPTNKGLRAIVRSCVNLDVLCIANCTNVSMSVFNGPWACVGIKSLDISDIYLTRKLTLKRDRLEEEQELQRFPPMSVDDYDEKLDFDKDGYYERIVEVSEDDIDHDFDVDDEELKDENGRRKLVFPKHHRNTPQQRQILREFYSKLGQFNQLVWLNTANGDYRIRVKDGLDLVLPALQQNLLTWDITRPVGYVFGDDELKWFGTNFGYGEEYTNDPEELERQKKRAEENEKRPLDSQVGRVGKLQSIAMLDYALEGGDPDIYEWFLLQGIDFDYVDNFEYSWQYDDDY